MVSCDNPKAWDLSDLAPIYVVAMCRIVRGIGTYSFKS